MTKIENDEKLLKDFFTANKQEIADNGPPCHASLARS